MEIVAWIAAGLVALVAVVLGPHNLRAWRVRRTLRSLPPGTRQRILDVLAALPPGPSRLLVSAEKPWDPEPLGSHLGGLPYAEGDEEWPLQGDGAPAPFMLQVRLDHPGLGPAWQGRLLAVFLQDDYEQTVRCYAEPGLGRGRTLEPPAGASPSAAIPLVGVNLPPPEGEEDEPHDPSFLVRKVPALAEILRPYGRDVGGLLARILEPRFYGYDLPVESAVLVGGQPELIQNPHEPACPECGGDMRFLFQFGDVVPGTPMGDAGVCYVYGCDGHPERCVAYVDSH